MKMKSIILSLFAIVVTLTSCQKENKSDNSPVYGESTYASFSLNVNTPGTYADTPKDNHADVVEQAITSVRLFIFNGGVLETMGDVAVTDNKGTATLQTTTGPKVIYAVANPNTDMTMAVGGTLDTFKKLTVAATSADLASTGDFVMVGETSATLTQFDKEAAIANPTPISVSRASAKAQLQYNPTNVKISPVVEGTFAEPNYQLAQCNTTMFLPRSGYDFTPNGAKAEQEDLAPEDGTYDHLQPVKYATTEEITAFDANYKAAAAAWDFKFANSFYMAENVNEAPVTGNTTFALIRLKYTPATKIIKGTNNVIANDGTFYAVKNAGAWDIYADKTEADAAQAAVPYKNLAGDEVTTAKVYTGGLCFYRLNIRDITKTALTEKYSVLRNNIYKINITEVNSIGGNSPLDPEVIIPTDPTTPLETLTHITADITIVPWTAVEMNEPLN